MHISIPSRVSRVTQILSQAGHEAYIVGGCVRDLVLGREPKDWDITTNADPETLVKLFEEAGDKVVYENSFGTVAIVHEDEPVDSPLRTVEITPYRTDSSYSDKRHPDAVTFSKTLEEDLQRRDFTINAMAMNCETFEIIDLYKGQDDLKLKVIRAVGNPLKRFDEDALRLMRAVRFAAQLDFTIEGDTAQALTAGSNALSFVSHERIRDEFIKILMSDNPMIGLELLRIHHLIEFISPELAEGIGVDQSRSHIYDVWEHCVRACDNAAKQNWPLHVRLAALFHDVGKPRTKRPDVEKKIFTFYGHEVVGARMVEKFLKRLRFPKELSETVVKLVRYHMFFSDTEQISLSAVRRMVTNVSKDHIWDLMNVRRSDRIGMGRPTAAPYRLRMYESMIEEALRDPIDVKMLKLNGDIMISEMGVKPGREIGWVLHALLEEVLEDPEKNTKEYLMSRAGELLLLDRETLRLLGEQGKETQEKADEELIQDLRKKHNV